MDRSRSRGTELPCKLREDLSLEMRRLSRMRSSSEEEQEEIILKSLREAVWPLLSSWEKMLNLAGLLLTRQFNLQGSLVPLLLSCN